jgi:RecB family exonuclease
MAGADDVWLSYALGDEGDLTAPHRLVRWAVEHGAEPHREPASRVARTASRTDARSFELCALAAGAPPRPDVAERVAVERARLAFFLDPRLPADAHTGRVIPASEPARRRFVAAVGGDAKERPIAVTAIERASSCAFAGFARRVLRVRRVDDLVESADNRERGTLVHRALQMAFESAREAADAPRAVAAARVGAARALKLEANMTPLRRESVLAAIEDAVAVVDRALGAGEGMRFYAAEQSFGDASPRAWPPLALAGEGGAVVYVDGQIDRIDVAQAGGRARVVDYKTGRLPAADDHGKTAFQLPLYAEVVAQALERDDVEALYVSLRPRGVIEEWPKGEEDRRALGARRGEIAEAARQVILRMWQGDVAPRPLSAGLCGRCEARDVCRRPAVAPVEDADDRA